MNQAVIRSSRLIATTLLVISMLGVQPLQLTYAAVNLLTAPQGSSSVLVNNSGDQPDAGTCTVKLSFQERVSNTGTIRIM
jgi:hypothetical protein